MDKDAPRTDLPRGVSESEITVRRRVEALVVRGDGQQYRVAGQEEVRDGRQPDLVIELFHRGDRS